MNQKIIESTLKIIENQKDECQWNDRLIQQDDFESFKDVLTERSKIIRKYYDENERLLKVINEYAKGPMDEERAETLFEAARQTILAGRLDPPMSMLLAKDLIEYYINNDNKERAICSIIFYATTAQDYYDRMDKSLYNEKLADYYEWIIDNSKYYCTYEDVRARNNTIIAYANYIFMLADTEDDRHLDRVLYLYGDLLRLWKSKEVQELDGDNKEVKTIFENNKYYALIEISEKCIGVTQEADRQIFAWMEEFYCEHENDIGWQKTVKSIQIRMDNLEHIINSMQSVQRWDGLLDEIPIPDWDEDMTRAREIFELSSDIVIWALASTKKTRHMDIYEKEQTVITLLHKYARLIDEVPYAYYSSYVKEVFRQIFINALPSVKQIRYKERILQELLIRRQPSTYLHSRMVEELSLMIAEEILDSEPELFLSMPLYDSVEELMAHREEFLDIIARGARLHDAGKCGIGSVIMQQSRRLTDDEFYLIKSHPVRGFDFFKETDDFEVYLDIIRGHHKNYDGTFGYPNDFDNTASSYRILIDLVSISDSADAATDIFGRNYAAGKDFSHLLNELKEGAGTRYNPDIVRIISNSPKLVEDLTELTSTRRIQYCYEAYRQYKG